MMKLVTSSIPFTFRYDGSTVLSLSDEPILVSESVLRTLLERYGNAIQYEDVVATEVEETEEETPEENESEEIEKDPADDTDLEDSSEVEETEEETSEPKKVAKSKAQK